jgi:hypothetical protein
MLYIDFQETDDPLIYGHFNKRIVRINGSFEAMRGVSNSSDVNLKEAIIPVDVLDKLSKIEISEWTYIDDSGSRHIEPMTQDSYKAFGLGKSETTITTIDADGVVLASIQALYQLWQAEKERNNRLEEKVDILLKRMNSIAK